MARILVADDEPDIRRIISIYLKRAGHQVIEAGTGTLALAVFTQERPDAAILDVVMPGMTGPDVAKTVRQTEAIADTPIILLSARALPHEVAYGLTSGADRYMVKPFSPASLLVTLTQVMENRATLHAQ